MSRTEHADRSRNLFLLDAGLINAAYILTTGVIQSGYLVHLGTSDFLTAILSNSMNFTNILCVLSYLVLEGRERRKRLLLGMHVISRTSIFLISLLPLMFHGTDRPDLMYLLLSVLIILSDLVFGIYRVGWTVWMMNTIPEEDKTSYLYKRMFLIQLVCAMTLFFSGLFLDLTGKGNTSYLILFLIAYGLSLLDVSVLSQTKEKPYSTLGLAHSNILQPLSHHLYRGYLAFVLSFYLLSTLSASFSNVYLIRYIQLDMGWISTAHIVSIGAMLLTNPFWKKREEVQGCPFVLTVSTSLLAGSYLISSFVNGGSATLPLIFLSFICAGIGNGGFIMAIFTYRHRIMPEENKTLFEGWFYFAVGLGTLAGPFTGRFLMKTLPVIENMIYRFSNFQLLYLVSAVALMLLAFVSFVRPGRVGRTDQTKQA